MTRKPQNPGQGRMEEERHDVEAGPGRTTTAQGENQVPKARMPHERDESSDSQAADNPSARRMGEIAHDDVMEGQQDTSKAQEMDATYHKVRQGAEPAPKEKPDRNQRGG
jgi:hypothetical protein